MPETDISLAIKAIDKTMDGFSSAKRNAKDYERALTDLDKKARDFKERNEGLRKVWAQSEAAMSSAKKAVKELGEAYAKSGKDADKANWEKAIEEQNELADAMKSVRKEMGENERAIASLGREAGKLTAKSGGSAKSGGMSGDVLSGWGVAIAGLAKQAGAALSGYAQQQLSSAIGSDASTMISGVLSGALAGAATGSVVPGVGTALGAVVGGASGLLSGLTQLNAEEDDAFRQYRDQSVQNAKAKGEEGLQSGISAAATRESNLLAFGSLLGSPENAKKTLDQIVNMANLTPYVYDDLVTVAKSLVNYGYGIDPSKDLIGTLTKIGDAGSAIGWSISDQVEVASKLGFMGKLANADTEQLKNLQQRGLDVYDWLAEHYGISVTELQEKISKRGVGGEEAANVILSNIEKEYGGSMEKQAGTYAGLTSTVQGLRAELDVAQGEGYTSARMAGLQAEREFLEGETSEDMKNALRLQGAAYANRENRNEAKAREILAGVYSGTETTTLDEAAAAKVQELRQVQLKIAEDQKSEDEKTRDEANARSVELQNQIEILTQSVQDTSDENVRWMNADLETAKYAGEIAAAIGSYKPGLLYAKEQKKGLVAYDENSWWNTKTPQTNTTNGFLGTRDFKPRAVGQHTIPYNNFPILAHEGEMLLTASEARQYQGRKKGADLRGIFAGAVFNVRTDSDIEAIAAKLAERLEWAEMTAS